MMINRRNLIKRVFSSTAAYFAASHGCQSYQNCIPIQNNIGFTSQFCEAGVDLPQVISAYKLQDQSQWCWAASISMLFAFYGYEVDQQKIVQAVYGGDVNLPALSGSVISSQLNRNWMDDNGKRFRSRMLGLYDFDAKILQLTNNQIIQALSNGTPLLIGNMSHAMVLISIAYVSTPSGPDVRNIGLLDPWPGRGARGPDHMGELIPMHMGGALRYLALPEIQPI